MKLQDILPAKLALSLLSLPSLPYYSPQELDNILLDWETKGVNVHTIGQSKNGHPIKAAILGTGWKTMLAWGYPHPDEPLGASALVWLGEQLLTGGLPDLWQWRFVLVLCADPDEASRQQWLEHPVTAQTFSRGCWRPTQLPWMVDYGFPLDWGPFYQPVEHEGACLTVEQCLKACGPDGCKYKTPPGPLPESMALVNAIELYRPQVVAAMHSTHTGGDYTFLLEREPRQTLQDIKNIPACFGLQRHLGEPIDRGFRWLKDSPDLIHEPTLKHFESQIMRSPKYNPDFVYLGNHSAAAYLEAKGQNIQFICPETTQFRHADFGNTSELRELVLTRTSIEKRRKGNYLMKRIQIEGKWIVVHQERVNEKEATFVEEMLPVTRGALGVSALVNKRKILSQIDDVWESIQAQEFKQHPYLQERELLKAPGAFIQDRSMLIFRTRSDYNRPATKAQAASFRWLWPLQTASILGNFSVFLSNQSQTPEIQAAYEKIIALQEDCLRGLPASLLEEAPTGPAMGSMLARVFCVMLARD